MRVTVSSISSNPLLGLNSLLRSGGSAAASVFAPAQSPANSSAPQRAGLSILPASSATQLSFDTILQLQMLDEPKAAEAKAPTPEELFLKEAQKTPMERMREQVLDALGLTEAQLAQMPPEERRAAEDRIRQMIEEKIRQAMNGGKAAPASNAEMLQTVA
ncbi:hypothetical protein [Terricaulis sp.]|uniref:hypothetical protein n=1 Tax=Terricaulis sp. TaxID=2768686 RepID=UPI0037834594